MPDYGPYKVHPVADAFPLLGPDEFKALVASIAESGQQERIVLLSDNTTIVDGRNRYLACWEARADPTFRVLRESYTEEQVIKFIINANIHRRQLTAGQRACVGLAIEEALAKQTKEQERSRKAGQATVANSPQSESAKKSRERAAKQVGTGDNSIQRAKKIKAVSKKILKQVETGELTLNEGYKMARVEEKAKQVSMPCSDPPPVSIRKTVTLRTHKGEEVEYPLPKSQPAFNPTNDHISWAAWSWNPVTGCLHGCKYCYARELAERDSYRAAYPVGFTPLFHHERLSAPHNTEVPKDVVNDPRKGRVFVCSMADLYGQWVPGDWIEQVHASCIANPKWEYLMLTKFPRRYIGLQLPSTAWIGTSVDEQKRVRIAEDAFREIRGVRVKWLSLEPLKENLLFTDLSMFDWVVIGSQTETQQPDGIVPAFAPPFEWVSKIVSQAREAGCKVYLKPNLLGATNPQSPGMEFPQEDPLPLNVLPLRQRSLSQKGSRP